MHYNTIPSSADKGGALSKEEFAAIIEEAIDQPQWRAQADKEADYMDGNQLDSELMQRMKAVGIPPAKENVIGPAIAAVCGYEAKTRTDWRVTPDGDPAGQEVADALNYRLNQAERHSKADAAMSEAFRPQIAVGLGWVEVTRNSDPFGYNKRCRYVHRNELYWDMRAKERDLSDARWLLRERFIHKSQAAAAFAQHRDLILDADSASGMGGYGTYVVEGGTSTGLLNHQDTSRAWTTREQAWYRRESDEVCIVELWYRRWVKAQILRIKGGRVVEFDPDNAMHQAAVASGQARLEVATVTRMRRSYWMGPYCLHDSASPFPFAQFPYVPFWGMREDMTGIPYGLVRDMVFPQDNLNSTISKLRWGMASMRTERTKGAVDMTDDQFRRQIARPDADIVLNAQHMMQQGARFEVKRDYQLNAQQFQLMADSRAALQRVGSVSASFMGQEGTARSGLQEQTQLEQSQISIADLMDSFKESRTLVGELLLALEIEDLGQELETIIIEGDTLNPARSVVLNEIQQDAATGMQYLRNDVLRTRIKLALEDVPTSSSFRAQQLSALSEAVKALPATVQQVMMPFMVDLMDLPRKQQVVDAIKQSSQQQDPEQMRTQIKQELMHDLKERELELREREIAAREKLMGAQQVQTGVQASFSAMQAGAQIAANPLIAPLADAVMQGAGYQRPNPGGDDPDFPMPEGVPVQPQPLPDAGGQGAALGEVQPNTSPEFPPVPQQAGTGMQGIETPSTGDNL